MLPKENYVFEGGLEDINDLEIRDTLPCPRLDEEVCTGIRDSVYRSALLSTLLEAGDDDYITED